MLLMAVIVTPTLQNAVLSVRVDKGTGLKPSRIANPSSKQKGVEALG